MKLNIANIALAALLACGTAASLSSCSEDKVYEVNALAVPQASDYADMVSVTVDQETNIATFEFNGKGVYPVWIIDGKSYSTNHKFTRYYRKAGDYTVEVKIGNANGISQAALPLTFHVDKTKMNGFGGFVYDSPYNMWPAGNAHLNSFYYAPGWSQIADPSYVMPGDGFTVTLPEATTDQWQAQMHIGTDIALVEGESYDGSLIVTTSKTLPGFTVKIHPDGDDDDAHAIYVKRHEVPAGEPMCIFWSDKTCVAGTSNLVYTFDFGGNEAGTEVIVESIVIKNHKDDDGTVVPDVSIPEPTWVAFDSADNMWNGCTWTNEFYYAPNWSQIADPILTEDADGIHISLPAATFDRWQAQVKFLTNIAIDNDEALDIRVDITSNNDIPAVTIKYTQTGNDDNFFTEERHDVAGGDATTKCWVSTVKPKQGAPMEATSLIFDFGGCPDGTEVTINKIIIQKHRD
ncbi:MAG: hypothetical protein Q4C34_03325 [Bacteroidales bacterium]|nr:hypothetical protein [Bacteroidales bacterium]